MGGSDRSVPATELQISCVVCIGVTGCTRSRSLLHLERFESKDDGDHSQGEGLWINIP